VDYKAIIAAIPSCFAINFSKIIDRFIRWRQCIEIQCPSARIMITFHRITMRIKCSILSLVSLFLHH